METAKDNSAHSENVITQEESRLFWKLWHWFYIWYFVNYANPLHTMILLSFSIRIFVCVGDRVVGAWLSVSVCKQSTPLLFVLLLVDSVTFCFQKNMYVQHYMNEGYLHCGILHWELSRHKTVSFSKVLDSFWVLVCSQHCVFSASLWSCKYEDIQVSCK